ncbi:MAG TPA: RagB/SusD family nutrient uptake outer membrane protein [Bacteroidales bacterium]|nr:RagB/SusD family nutrient uptake outer membrane protein [Bacteroidales bacterium]
MKKKLIILATFFSALMITSCVKDLDVKPKDPNIILSGNLNDDPVYMKEVLGKIYASFVIPGQGGSEDYNGVDITASDPNFFTTLRALWNLQELPTDEAICAWGDPGISDLNTQTWSANNPFLTALYQRLSLSITYANDFIGKTNGSADPNVMRYNAEARFLRALSYYWAIDLFGKFPFTTEADGVGKYFPKVGTRQEIFTYIESELKDIENKLGDSGFSYPEADKGACRMLLARLYLNAEIFTGQERWNDCKTYCDKVINDPAYSLATDYRHNFTADNGYSSNKEMIFGFEEDGKYTQGYIGTTFIIESSSDATYLPAERYHGLTSNTNWNGNRATKQFLNVMVDTIATYGNNPIPTDDSTFTQCPDKRVYLKRKRTIDIPSASASGDFGVGVYKFTARNADGSQAANYNPAYASTDFPVFRLADAYLMRAEVYHRNGDDANAAKDINVIRERAYGNTDGNISAGDVTDMFLLNERGREFYYEAQRRTDLVRFGQFTNGTYAWAWKGNVHEGTQTDKHYDLYPIPADELAANPNYNNTNNPGY